MEFFEIPQKILKHLECVLESGEETGGEGERGRTGGGAGRRRGSNIELFFQRGKTEIIKCWQPTEDLYKRLAVQR